ncbi:MAG: TonB-dependent receptor, partial [Azonexus sp.]|nr:TonB-dependent receptor [Azonexus sp.]
SSAGSAHIDYFRRLDDPLAALTMGENGYTRGLLAGSPALGGGHLLYALELFHHDGPWQVDEHYRKFNGLLRYSQGSRFDGWSVTGMAYRGRWTSTDQIPQRAVDSGRLDRFGSLDPTTGGEAFRYSLAGEWARRGEQSQSRASLWWQHVGLDLWSNFQYCLNDMAATGACGSGDQFKQAERRQAAGFAVAKSLFDRWGGFEVENAFGLQGRFDRIQPLGLYATHARHTVTTVREDQVKQYSLALWAQNETRWNTWFRSIQGLRADAYWFDVDADRPINGGQADDRMLTPKLSLIFGPWRATEFYINYGHGFHSNDARGTTIRVDPGDGTTPVARVRPLVRTRGYELGLRSEIARGWQSSVALWQLDADSELLFVGDAGTTEASRPSRRYGVEWSNLYVPNDWLAIDADLAWSHARFRDTAAAGDRIPGAVTTTANLGLTVDRLGPWFGALRLRYFGPRPLIEDNSLRADSSTLTNLRLGYRLARRTQVALDVYNLFDRRLNDIEYGYDSQLTDEAAPVFDRHMHPTEGRTLRLTLTHRF